jgi:hypothetical protein
MVFIDAFDKSGKVPPVLVDGQGTFLRSLNEARWNKRGRLKIPQRKEGLTLKKWEELPCWPRNGNCLGCNQWESIHSNIGMNEHERLGPLGPLQYVDASLMLASKQIERYRNAFTFHAMFQVLSCLMWTTDFPPIYIDSTNFPKEFPFNPRISQVSRRTNKKWSTNAIVCGF